MAKNMVTGASLALILLSGAVLTGCDEPESQPPAQQTTVPTDRPVSGTPQTPTKVAPGKESTGQPQDQQDKKPAGEQEKPQQQGEQR